MRQVPILTWKDWLRAVTAHAAEEQIPTWLFLTAPLQLSLWNQEHIVTSGINRTRYLLYKLDPREIQSREEWS